MLSFANKAIKSMFEDKTHRLGAALSYYAIFSLVPLLVISLSIASLVLPESAGQGQILKQVSLFFGGPVAELVSSAIYSIQNSSQNLLATVLLVAILIFGATGVFRQLKDALNTIWKIDDKNRGLIPGLLAKNVLGVLTIFFTAALLIVWTLLNVTASYIQGSLFGPELSLAFWQGLSFAGSLFIGTIIVATIFAVFPDKKLRVSDMLLPGFITAILFTILRFAFSAYLNVWHFGSAYGAASSIIVFLAWVYLVAQVLLFGAEFSKFYLKAKKKK